MDATNETDDAGGTRAAIMDATYDALRKHGYADLTIQRIADEFDKSKSLLYYHYESKDDLLVEFLDYGLERFAEQVAIDPEAEPDEQLRTFLDSLVPESLAEDRHEFHVAFIEMRSQAPFSEPYHEQFTKSDAFIRDTLAEIIEDGIERGVFREVDPMEKAELLVTITTGAMVRRVTTDVGDGMAAVRRAVDDYIESELLVAE